MKAAQEAMVTTVPWLVLAMEGTNSRTVRKWERMLTLKVFSTEAWLELRSIEPLPMPALLTRMVGLPRVERTVAATSERDSVEVMSQVKWWILDPSQR